MPLLEGIIVRMYTIRGKSTGVGYVEVLLSGGGTVVMRVALAEQISLVELFRLYYCYHFLRVRIVARGVLEFVGTSKFYEVETKDRMERVRELLRDRLVDIGKLRELKSNIRSNKDRCYIDIIVKTAKIIIDDT